MHFCTVRYVTPIQRQAVRLALNDVQPYSVPAGVHIRVNNRVTHSQRGVRIASSNFVKRTLTLYAPWFHANRKERARIMLHEIVHLRDVRVKDYAYAHEAAYSTLTPRLRRRNADSIVEDLLYVSMNDHMHTSA